VTLFKQFLMSGHTLWVYGGNRLLFASSKPGVQSLLEYIGKAVLSQGVVKIFDKVVGNASALLSIKAGCKEVYSPLGSELAIKTLRYYNIQYHFSRITPYIRNREGEDMCPMEKLSLNKSPEEFYESIRLQ